MLQKKKNRKTVADLAQEVALAEMCRDIHRTNSTLTRSVLHLLKKEDVRKKRRDNDDVGCDPKKGKGPLEVLVRESTSISVESVKV